MFSDLCYYCPSCKQKPCDKSRGDFHDSCLDNYYKLSSAQQLNDNRQVHEELASLQSSLFAVSKSINQLAQQVFDIKGNLQPTSQTINNSWQSPAQPPSYTDVYQLTL